MRRETSASVNWWDARRVRCSQRSGWMQKPTFAQSAEQEPFRKKTPREVISSVQGFQNTVLCGGNCGNEVLKSWGVKIGMGGVTWLGVWVGFGMLLSSHRDARPGCLKASRAGCRWETKEISIKPPAILGVTATLWVTYWKQVGEIGEKKDSCVPLASVLSQFAGLQIRSFSLVSLAGFSVQVPQGCDKEEVRMAL